MMAAGEVKDLGTIAAMFVLTILQTVVAHFKGRRRDRQTKSDLKQRFDALDQKIDIHQHSTRRSLRRVAGRVTKCVHHLVGPDGKNGIRSRVEDLETRLDERDERERESLERKLETRSAAGQPPGFTVSPISAKGSNTP
jgi:hypothetical protein